MAAWICRCLFLAQGCRLGALHSPRLATMMAIGGTIKAVKEAVVRTLMSGPAQVHYGRSMLRAGRSFRT